MKCVGSYLFCSMHHQNLFHLLRHPQYQVKSKRSAHKFTKISNLTVFILRTRYLLYETAVCLVRMCLIFGTVEEKFFCHFLLFSCMWTTCCHGNVKKGRYLSSNWTLSWIPLIASWKYLIHSSSGCEFGNSIHLYFASSERSKASIISLCLRIYPCPMPLPLSFSFCCHPPHLFIFSLCSTFGPYICVRTKPATL
jgi:hypothetical protein